MNTYTEALARYVADTDFSDFPTTIVSKAKRCILDSVGCTLGGYVSDPGRKVADLICSLGGSDATIIGSRRKASLPNAALANTYLANVLDYDDSYRGHPGCTIVPPALAGAEMTHASGRELLTAVIVGYEVHSRVARAMYTSPETVDKIDGVAYQTFGSVASSSSVLSLSLDATLDAFGIAGATAPVQSNLKTGGSSDSPPSTMKVGFYQCSSVGTMSALMAKKGIGGPHDIFEGETGFWRMTGADKCDFEELTYNLGKEYEITNVAFKPYSCCRWFHSSLDAVLFIIQEHGVKIEKVKEIRAETMGGKRNLEYMKNPRPTNFVAAEFSLPYSIAVALAGLKPGPDWISTETMNNRVILDTAAKAVCSFQQKSSMSGSPNEIHRWPANVEISVKDGSHLSKRIEHPKGSPQNPLSEEELKMKFLRLASHIMSQEDANGLLEMVNRLEQVDDVGELTNLIGNKR